MRRRAASGTAKSCRGLGPATRPQASLASQTAIESNNTMAQNFFEMIPLSSSCLTTGIASDPLRNARPGDAFALLVAPGKELDLSVTAATTQGMPAGDTLTVRLNTEAAQQGGADEYFVEIKDKPSFRNPHAVKIPRNRLAYR